MFSTGSYTDNASRPVDVSNRDKEVADRIEREKEAVQEKFTMSRSNSRPGIERPAAAAAAASAPQPKSPAAKVPGPSLVPTVRPTLSFANVAAKKESALKMSTDAEEVAAEAEKVSEDLANVEL
jgi:translation initiation factor 4B